MGEGTREGGSAFDEIEALSRESESLAALKAEIESKIRDLRAGEDFKAGKFHAQEIFENQQEKLRLETEIELIRKKINRLRLSSDPTGLLQ
jgi:hypothetical protein